VAVAAASTTTRNGALRQARTPPTHTPAGRARPARWCPSVSPVVTTSAASRMTAAVSSRRSAQGGKEIRWRSTGPANRNANVPADRAIRPAANSVGSFTVFSC